MATKKPSKPAPAASNPSFRGFLNIDLNETDKATIKRSEFTAELFDSFLEKKISDGLKFTFSYDDYSHCYQVIGTWNIKTHEDYGILVSGRGSTPIKAFKQWCYIVDTLIDGQSWSELLLRKETVEIDD